MDWMDEIASEPVLDEAYAWLCERRLDYSPNDDVWDVRWRWAELRPKLQEWLRAGVYRIGAVRRFPAGDVTVEVRPALDALVLKATALVLFGVARLGRRPEGAATDQPRATPWGRYASIDHEILLAMLDRHVPDRCPIAILAAPIRPVLGGGAESPIGGRLGFRRRYLWQGVNGPRIIGTTGTKLLYFD
jgi:hypothetical protein